MPYLSHLSRDRKLARVLSEQEPVKLRSHKNIPLRLCASIMSQQLSTKVAKIIFARFLQLYNGQEPTPQQIVDTSPETLRGIGLSNAKVQYVRNVAQFAMDHQLEDKQFKKMADEEIMSLLTQIKGVGRWTVEMLLMFTLGRKDVFAVDDYGIQSAMKKIYKLDDSDKRAFKEKMISISKQWSPYRTYACLHLWRWKDTTVKEKVD